MPSTIVTGKPICKPAPLSAASCGNLAASGISRDSGNVAAFDIGWRSSASDCTHLEKTGDCAPHAACERGGKHRQDKGEPERKMRNATVQTDCCRHNAAHR